MALLTGIIPALVTPFDSEGQVNLAMIRELIEFQLAQGVRGFFVCGWTGEWALLNEAERRLIAETSVDQVRRRAPVVIHVGSSTTAESVRLAAHAEEVHADAISAKPPGVYPCGWEGVRDYYRDIAGVCSLPLYVYNEPAANADTFTPELYQKLCRDVPTLAGMKLTSRDLHLMRQFLDVDPGDRKLNLVSGMEDVLLGALAMGADGSIGLMYNLIPRQFVDIYSAFRSGAIPSAAGLQARVNQVIDVFDCFYGVAGLSVFKGMMKLLGFDCGWGRRPQPPLTPAQMEQVRLALDSVNFWQLATARSPEHDLSVYSRPQSA